MLSKCVVLINVSVDDTIAKILRLETRKERRKDTTLHKKKKKQEIWNTTNKFNTDQRVHTDANLQTESVRMHRWRNWSRTLSNIKNAIWENLDGLSVFLTFILFPFKSFNMYFFLVAYKNDENDREKNKNPVTHINVLRRVF